MSSSSAHTGVRISGTFYLDGPGTYEKFLEWLEVHGEVKGEIDTMVTSADLRQLDLPAQHKDTIIKALVEQGIRTINQLCRLTEAELLALDEITWLRYRPIVQALHWLGRYLKDAPDPKDMLELLSLHIRTYQAIRRVKYGSGELYFRTISDVTRHDIVAMEKIFSRDGGILDELTAALAGMGLDFAPLYATRTVADVMPWSWRGITTVAGLPAGTLISDLTPLVIDRLPASPGRDHLLLVLEANRRRLPAPTCATCAA